MVWSAATTRRRRRYALDKIEAAIGQLGGRLERMSCAAVFVSNIAHWEAVARVHGERFGHIRPVDALVEQAGRAGISGVEIEAEAIVGAGEGLA